MSLAFFSSKYGEPINRIGSLGGDIFSRVNNTLNSIFDPVSEYKSTNGSYDYRVLYIKNISSKLGVTINAPVITVRHLFDKKRELFYTEDLTRIKINIFIPDYVNKNQPHPEIYSNGTFINNQLPSLENLIFRNSNNRRYGSRVFLDFLSLEPSEYFPIVIERVVRSPVPFVRSFDYELSAMYTVVQ